MSSKHAPLCRPVISLLLILAGIGPGVRLARGQSLADVSKKEEARRKTIPEAAKVYTNKDLNAQPAGSPPPPAPAASAKAGDAPKAAEKDGKDAKDKDKSYWSGRMKKLQDQVERDESYVLAIQTRINSLTADFVNRDDPAQRVIIERDRQKALAELSRLKKSITDGKKSIVDLEEEARHAGIPPGWLR